VRASAMEWCLRPGCAGVVGGQQVPHHCALSRWVPMDWSPRAPLRSEVLTALRTNGSSLGRVRGKEPPCAPALQPCQPKLPFAHARAHTCCPNASTSLCQQAQWGRLTGLGLSAELRVRVRAQLGGGR